MFPLGSALLPGEQLPLRIFEPRYRQMLADVTDSAGEDQQSGFGVVLIARGHEVGGGEERYDIGTFATIDQLVTDPGTGQSMLTCVGRWRFVVEAWLPDDPYPRARIRRLPEPADDPTVVPGLLDVGTRIRELVEETFTARGVPIDDDVPRFDADDLAAVGVYGWAARLPIGSADRQTLLEADDPATRARVLDDAVETLIARIRFGA
ncbi:LON peptidase substrate-binding domain-containing protein [Gordonia sp. NPDC003376]